MDGTESLGAAAAGSDACFHVEAVALSQYAVALVVIGYQKSTGIYCIDAFLRLLGMRLRSLTALPLGRGFCGGLPGLKTIARGFLIDSKQPLRLYYT